MEGMIGIDVTELSPAERLRAGERRQEFETLPNGNVIARRGAKRPLIPRVPGAKGKYYVRQEEKLRRAKETPRIRRIIDEFGEDKLREDLSIDWRKMPADYTIKYLAHADAETRKNCLESVSDKTKSRKEFAKKLFGKVCRVTLTKKYSSSIRKFLAEEAGIKIHKKENNKRDDNDDLATKTTKSHKKEKKNHSKKESAHPILPVVEGPIVNM